MPTLRAELTWSQEAPHVARAVLRAWLASVDCDRSTAANLVLAASELVTRAVNSCPAAPILECSAGPAGTLLAVGSAAMLDDAGGADDISDAVLRAVCDAWGCDGDGTSTSLWALVRS